MVDTHDLEYSKTLRACASKIRRSGALGSGQILPRLFEYLVECALDGKVPKEFDIAVDAFGKDVRHGYGGDAQIRVWIYRLRSRLQRYYADAGTDDPFRIEIPNGTYKISLVERTSGQHASPIRLPSKLALAVGSLALTAVFVVTVSSFVFDRIAPLESTPVWSGLAEGERPILLVVGDHFFFGAPDSPIRIRNVYINSEDDFRQSQEFQSNPDLVFETLSYLPKSVAFSLPAILPRVRATNRSYALKLASELTAEDLRVADIVFIGFVRSMGLFREYYSKISNFDARPPYLEIEHAPTGDTFVRSGPLSKSNRDYGLFARFDGPTGNKILLFSGIGDPGVLATARALNSTNGIRRLEELIESSGVDPEGSWEVLLEVDGHSRTDLDYRMIGVFRLRSAPSTTKAE